MQIIEMLLTPNKYSRPQTPLKQVKGVAIHYVGNPGSSAKGNRNYFENLKSGSNGIYASSHYIIGLDGEIIKCIPETEWAYCTNNRNCDTISIENCHPLSDGKFNSKTYSSLVELTADICKRYKLNPLTDIIRHYDVTKKTCPLWHVNHPEDFDAFKWDVKKTMETDTMEDTSTKYIKMNVNGDIFDLKGTNENGVITASIKELARIFGDAKIQLRPVLDNLGFDVSWKDGTIMAMTHGVCNNEMLKLRKIVEAEAGGEPHDGKIAVTNVIMNRVKSKQFPNSITEIIYQPNQFSPITNGAYDKAVPSKDTINAVEEALNNPDNTDGATYFRTVAGSSGSWHEKSLTKTVVIGNHAFYK